MRFLASVVLVSLLSLPALARDKHDHASPGWGTSPVFRADGDTFATYSVSCTTTTTTQVRPAVVDRSRRRLRIQNRSADYRVNLGTSTTAASELWTLGESTNTATPPMLDTHNSGAIRCWVSNGATGGATATATLQVLEEDAIEDQTGNQ